MTPAPAGAATGSARAPLPGEGIETAEPSGRSAGSLISTIAPPPPPTAPLRCPEAPHCPPESEFAILAWLFVGAAAIGMLLTTTWGAMQHRRAKVIREELSRIRIQRTSQIRATRSLAEVQMPPAGLGRQPAPLPPPPAAPAPAAAPPSTGPKVPLAAAAAAAVASVPIEVSPVTAVHRPPLADEADARLATAQAELEPLLFTAHSVEDWFRSKEFEAALIAAGSQRAIHDRVRRGVVAVSATMHALRDARIFPQSHEAIDDAIEGYWEQVYESLDDVYRLVNLVASEEGRRAVASAPGGEALSAQLGRLLEAARAYLASDGRRPIPIEPLRTDYDRRLHQATDARVVAGVPPGKILSVNKCGIVRDGKLIRKPEVVQSL